MMARTTKKSSRSTASRSTASKKTATAKKSSGKKKTVFQKLLTAEGWKRLMMGKLHKKSR